MVEDLTWEVAPQITISDVTSKNQDINLYDSGANILTSGPHGQRWSDYYAGINKVLDMTDLVYTNSARLSSADFSFMIKPNGPVKDSYIVIVPNIIDFPAKGISPPIRYVSLVTSIMKNHTNLVGNNYLLPRTTEKDICLLAIN